jgi:glycosyltransferase involved in cell wall biosynthesis
LDTLQWCEDIIVVDSYSEDHTEEICRSEGVSFFQHHFEGFGNQRNWALENTSPKNDWILILDADERVSPELAKEICEVVASSQENVNAYRVKRRFFMWGRWLRYSSLYPTWVVRLVHKDRVRYINRGHAETQEVEGETLALKHDLIDENLKGTDEWFERQNRYSRKDAEFELAQESSPMRISELFHSDPLVRRSFLKKVSMRIPMRPTLFFLYCYVWRLGFLDGKDGFIFCLMKAIYQRMIMIKKYDLRRLTLD